MNMFSKLSAYTQKNMARREENIKRTEEMRETAKEMREEKGFGRPNNSEIRKPFRPSGFGNRHNG